MGKLIQLIDPNARQELCVRGVTFDIRAVNGILKSDLATAFTTDKEGSLVSPASNMLPVMSKIITAFRDFPDMTPYEVLERIPDGELIAEIFQAVISAVMLTEDESKNSDSSLGSPSTDLTRTVADANGAGVDASKGATI